MAEGERDLGGVDDSQRLTINELMGGDKAEARINSSIGRVEDPQSKQDELHRIDTKAVSEGEPYDWQSKDPELSDNTTPYDHETGVGGKQHTADSSNVVPIERAKSYRPKKENDNDQHGPEVA